MGGMAVSSRIRRGHLLLAAAMSACGAPSEQNRAHPVGSVCPGCRPLAGGESSDFEGGLAACTAFARRTAKSDEQAIELGYDMPRVRSLVERDFSAPLRWTATEYLP